jgi:hypothetical protein
MYNICARDIDSYITINDVEFNKDINIYQSRPKFDPPLTAQINKKKNLGFKIFLYFLYTLASVATLGVFALIDHTVNGCFRLRILYALRGNSQCIYLDEFKSGKTTPIEDCHTGWLFKDRRYRKFVAVNWVELYISEENHNKLCGKPSKKK